MIQSYLQFVRRQTLISTRLQPGVPVTMVSPNRFNGFCEKEETAEAVSNREPASYTRLKPGANESTLRPAQVLVASAT